MKLVKVPSGKISHEISQGVKGTVTKYLIELVKVLGGKRTRGISQCLVAKYLMELVGPGGKKISSGISLVQGGKTSRGISQCAGGR